ncbi:M20 aminoacylase family protein [Azospirillum canadense]|uniref:M20 aminoacylase family protein n=1 Tax=Azospirillum canadense TaxID=403962 RepID=UPI002226A911|nr:M20 aminoacylase family protein [Azospirillum canadense]MCW2240480.1 hippurate hydrolase [Azospirillum canadense]
MSRTNEPGGSRNAMDVATIAEEMRAIRRHLHQNPETAFSEFGTSALVASRLKDWGYDVTEGVAGTGVVGTLRIGSGRASIGLRADMDALRITEETGLPHASVKDGVMHACGHDGHTAMLLGAACNLAQTRNFTGTVHLFFQPAEEIGHDSGGERMVKEGLFERFPCDAVFGMHTHPGLPVGHFLTKAGPFMAAADKMVITIDGVGGHAGRPHLTVDAAVVAAGIGMALQTIVARNVNPIEPAVVTVGVLQAGTVYNAVAGTARLELSIRSFSETTRQRLCTRIRDMVHAQAESYGAKAVIDWLPGYPVLVNDATAAALAASVAREVIGADCVDADAAPMMTSEDFAYMLQQRPGCFLRIGNGVDSKAVHNPGYDFDDQCLPVGIAFWTRLVERFLEQGVAPRMADRTE